MKLIIVIMTACLLQVSAAGFAQKLTYSKKGATLEQIFSEIRKQTGYFVVYAEDKVDKQTKLDVNFKNTDLKDVLEVISKSQDLTYSFNEKNIGLKPKEEPSFLERLADRWAAIDITGTVLDDKGYPLPGATVKAKGSKSVITDIKGRFMLEKVEEGAIVTISYTGYVTQEVPAKQAMGTIALKLSDNPLDQVQIIAYGTTTKRLSTSNTATVSAREIEQQPVSNPLLALQGRVPGLQVTQANGVPGGGITVRIQGRNNLDNTSSGSGSDPLYVIDGVPYASQNLSTFKGGGESYPILGSSTNDGLGSVRSYGNPLAFINPADIEAITVLKDADATAIYGSRAANGAILITTKKGKIGDIKIDFNLQNGWGKVGHKMDLLNSEQYMEMRREAKRNDNVSVLITDYDLRGLWDTTRYTDWQKELIGGTAGFSRLSAGVSGGTTQIQYLINTTYGRETTVFPGDFANTFGSVHFNVSASSPNQRFKIQLGGSYMANKNKLPSEDFTNHAINLPPVAPALYNADGTLNWAPDPLANGNSSWFNPVARQYNQFDTNTQNLVSNGSIGYRILPGFNFRSTFGFTSTVFDQFIAAQDNSFKPEERLGRIRSANFSSGTSRSWIVEPQLNFQRKMGDHSIGILLGTTFQHQSNNGRDFAVSGQSSEQLLRNIGAGTSLSAGSEISVYRYNALFGRVSYSFKDKYLVNLTGRRDGSSRFGNNSQFNNFGAVGLGWIISEESYIKDNLTFLSFAKLRGSYGTTGSDQIGNYKFMSLYSQFNPTIPYQGQGGLSASGLPNPNLEWEETRKLQAGIDLGFLKDRINVTVDYIRNRTSNSLTEFPVPLITGYKVFITNIDALIQNTGWEFAIVTQNINKASMLRWSSSINLTIPRNKLLAFPGMDKSLLRQYMAIGQPLGTISTYHFYGVDPLTGLFLVTNKNGEPTSTPVDEDKTVFLNRTPHWYGGIQNNVSYKGFSLDFLVQVTKQSAINPLQFGDPGTFAIYDSSVYGNQPVGAMQRWQKPGDVSVYQRFSSNFSLVGNSSGDRDFSDASYVRLKNVSISYQFPLQIIRKMSMQQLRVFVNAQNLITLTSYKGLDPENLTVLSLPPLRMIVTGVQVTF